VGNPQNMIIGHLSGIPFLRFSFSLLPVAVAGLVIQYAVLSFGFRKVLRNAVIHRPACVAEAAVASKQPESSHMSREPAMGDTPARRRPEVQSRPLDRHLLTLTVGVQAETRIVPNETKPDCPFPATLELVAPMDNGRLAVGVPIDMPFSELNKLLEAQLKGHRFPEGGSAPVEVEVRGASLAAAGDRLLISLRVKARERKSWFGFGAQATVHIWGKPALDAKAQILRLTNLTLAVESEAAFGLLGAAARAAMPYLQDAIADKAVVDLKPFAADALTKITAALADFQKNSEDVRVDAAVHELRLTGIEFDSHTLRVIAEADGTAKVFVTELPKM